MKLGESNSNKLKWAQTKAQENQKVNKETLSGNCTHINWWEILNIYQYYTNTKRVAGNQISKTCIRGLSFPLLPNFTNQNY